LIGTATLTTNLESGPPVYMRKTSQEQCHYERSRINLAVSFFHLKNRWLNLCSEGPSLRNIGARPSQGRVPVPPLESMRQIQEFFKGAKGRDLGTNVPQWDLGPKPR